MDRKYNIISTTKSGIILIKRLKSVNPSSEKSKENLFLSWFNDVRSIRTATSLPGQGWAGLKSY